jgi:hypothetical protein
MAALQRGQAMVPRFFDRSATNAFQQRYRRQRSAEFVGCSGYRPLQPEAFC